MSGGSPLSPRILTTGPIPVEAAARLAPLGRIELAPALDEAGLMQAIGGATALVVRGGVRITGAVIRAGRELRVVGRSGVGYDNVDIMAATACGIPVVYAPGVGALAVAEGALAMLLSLVKQLPELDRRTRAGDWGARDVVAVGDLRGLVLGIVGWGRIGREFSRMALALGISVLVTDPLATASDAEAAGVRLVTLDELLVRSDAVSLHAPLTESSRGLLSRERLARMRRGAILLNLARGGLLADLDAVLEALESGQLAGVGLDVYPEEPPDPRHPLFRHPALLCTPHALGLSQQARREIFLTMAQGMVDVWEGRRPQFLVNPEVWEAGGRREAE